MNIHLTKTLALSLLLWVVGSSTLQAQSKIWGQTAGGGAGTSGAIVNMNGDASGLQTNHLFLNTVSSPGNAQQGYFNSRLNELTHLVEMGGRLYGTRICGGPNPGASLTSSTGGVLFQLDPATGLSTTLYSFSLATGSNPMGSLTAVNGVLWGMTTFGGNTALNQGNGYGTIFSFNPATSEYTTVYKFSNSPDGGLPRGTLFFNPNDNLLYGMTSNGGPTSTSYSGTLFSIDPAAGASSFKVLSNNGGTSGLILYNNLLYGINLPASGATDGSIFSYDPVASVYTTLYSLPVLNGGLTLYNGIFYGVAAGGTLSGGNLFSFNPVGNVYTDLFDMNNSNGDPNGGLPLCDLVVYNGQLWGTTTTGGVSDNNGGEGVIFNFDLAAKRYTPVYPFLYNDYNNSYEAHLYDGGTCMGGLTLYNNKLYGITTTNSLGGNGSVFSWDPAVSKIQNLVYFGINNVNGGSPQGNLCSYNKLLYGATSKGGFAGDGILFSIDPVTNNFSQLKDFNQDTSGGLPSGNPVAFNGKLYGLLSAGGGASATNGLGNAYGSIYEYDPATGKTNIPYVFSSDYSVAGGGGSPAGPLVLYNNLLYGVTTDGGDANGDGTIFSFDPVSHAYRVVYNFDGTNSGSYAGPLLLFNGLLYGYTAYGGPKGSGLLYSFNPATGAFADLLDFLTIPTPKVLTVYNNLLYGASNQGGTQGNGLLFSFDPVSKTATDLYDLTTRFFPLNNILIGYKGQLLGGSRYYGANNAGYLYSFDLTSKVYKETLVFTSSGPNIPVSIMVLKSNPTITFGNVAATYGQADIALSATSTNTNAANPVTYTIADPGIATMVSGKLHILKAGTTIITAGQLEDEDNYADTVQRQLVVAKAALGVSAAAVSISYGTPIPASFTAAYSGFVGTDNAAVLTGAPVFSTTATSASLPGDYPINVDTTAMSAANYRFVITSGHLTITPAATTIQFGTLPATFTYGDVPFDPGATANSGATPVYSSGNTAVAIVTGDNKIQFTGAGTVTITATFPATATYSGGSKDLTITVAKKNITLSVNNAYILSGTAIPGFTASFSGLVNGDPVSVVSPAPQFSTTASSSSPAGNYPVTVTNIAALTALNYTINPTYQQGTLTIGSVAFNGSDTRIYGAAPYDPGATSNNGTMPVYASSNSQVAIINSSNKVQLVGAGEVTITGSFPASGSDPAMTVTQTLTVQPAPLTVRAADASRPYGQPNPSFSFTYQGFVYNDDARVLLTPALAGSSATLSSAPGTYPVTPYNATAANYIITNAAGLLTVTQAPQSITFDPLSVQSTGNADFALTATASSGLPVTYSSSNPNVAMIVNGSSVHITGAGTAIITASQAGNGNYLAAPNVQQTLTVNGLSTTISLPAIPSVNYGVPDFVVTATSNNNAMPIVYISSNTAVATVDANGVVHITGAGITTITASQAGNSVYSPGSSLPQTLSVTKAPLVVTVYNQTLYQGQPVSPFVIGYSGFVNGDDTTSIGTKATASTPATVSSPIGTYPIYLGGAVAANYSFSYVQGMITVLPAQPQSISFNTLPLERYGNVDFDPGASSTSGQPVIYTTSDPTVATIVNGQVHLTGAGRVTITATQPGGNGYSPAAAVAQTISVGKGQLVIRPDDVTLGVGQALPNFTVTYTGFVNGDDSSSLTKLPVVATTAEQGFNFGQYAIIASGAASSNYAITYQPGVLTVTAASDRLNAFVSSPGQVTVSIFTGTVQKAVIQLYSLGGQLVTEQSVQLFKNVNNFTLGTGSIAAGIYIVKVWGEVSKMNQKIIIK